MTPQEHLSGCDGHHTPRQACNSHAGDAVPSHLSRAGIPASAVAVAPVSAREVDAAEVGASGHAIADGPLETIDTAHVPVLPLVALALVTAACIVVVWRLLLRRSRH